MSESLILAQIKSILESVSGIGVVYDYEVYITAEENVPLASAEQMWLDLMTKDGTVNGWQIHREATPAERFDLPRIMRTHIYRIMGIHEMSDHGASEKDFQAIVDAIFDAFKSKYNLNGTADNSGPVQIESVSTATYAYRLFHTAELTMEVEERTAYS